MPQFKDPKYKDARGISDGMEKGPEYKKNLQEAVQQIQGAFGGQPEERNEFSDSMGGNGKLHPSASGRSMETPGTNPDQDRAMAYAALEQLQRRRAVDDQYAKTMAERQMAAKPQQQAPSDDEFNSSIQQFMQTRKLLGK